MSALEFSTFYRNLILSDSSVINQNPPLRTINAIKHRIPDSKSLERISFFINNSVEAAETISWELDMEEILLMLFWSKRLGIDKLRDLSLNTIKVFFVDMDIHALALRANDEGGSCPDLHVQKCYFSVTLFCY